MTPKDDLREWILKNYNPAVSDFIANIVELHALDCGWKEDDVGELLDVLHYELREVLMNVVESYEEEVTE